MNILNTNPLLYMAGALLISLGGNGAQLLLAKAARSDHAAALATIKTDQATANAAAAELRASSIGVVALLTAADDAEMLERIEAATARIEGAATNYKRATNAKPLDPACRADADRVRSINHARGHSG